MDTIKIREIVAKNIELWKELKRRWGELGLPGSEYAPNDFLACLLLSQSKETNAEALAQKIREAANTLTELKRDTSLNEPMIGHDAQMVIALSILGQTETKTAPPPRLVPLTPLFNIRPPVTECPHCQHKFEACAEGEYAKPTAEPAKNIPKTSNDETSSFEPCIHVDANGKCNACTKEATTDCYTCDENIIKNKANRCKNKDCDKVYCNECKDIFLNYYGYCQNCSIVACCSCNGDIDNGEQKNCANPKCKAKNDYCDSCAEMLLNKDGLCVSCSDEEEIECSECDNIFTSSRVTACTYNACGSSFCNGCKKDMLNENGYCNDCAIIECLS